MSESTTFQEQPAGNGPLHDVHIHLQKSTQFRVVHADGAWFSASPANSSAPVSARNIHISFYNERVIIPKKIVVKADANGNPKSQDLSDPSNLKGFHRELEVDVVMTISAIEELVKRLKDIVAVANRHAENK